MLHRTDPKKQEEAARIWIATINSALFAIYLRPNFGRVDNEKVFAYLAQKVMPQWRINNFSDEYLAEIRRKIYLATTAPDFGEEVSEGRFLRSRKAVEKIIFSMWDIGAHEILRLYGHCNGSCTWDTMPVEQKKICPIFTINHQKFSDVVAEILRYRAEKNSQKTRTIKKG